MVDGGAPGENLSSVDISWSCIVCFMASTPLGFFKSTPSNAAIIKDLIRSPLTWKWALLLEHKGFGWKWIEMKPFIRWLVERRGQEILTPDPASPPPLPVLDPVLPPPSTAAVFRLLRSVEGRRLGDRYQMVSAPNCRAAGLGSSTTTTMSPDTGSYKLQWSLQCSKGWNQGRRISAVGRLF